MVNGSVSTCLFYKARLSTDRCFWLRSGRRDSSSIRRSCLKKKRTSLTFTHSFQGIEMVKIKCSATSHRREVLKQIVERYLHKRKEDSRRDDSENLRDIKVTQELMWQELGKRVDGFPRSPFALTPGRRLTAFQVQSASCV